LELIYTYILMNMQLSMIHGGSPSKLPKQEGNLMKTSSNEKKKKSVSNSPLTNTLMIGLAICALLSISANILHDDTFSHHDNNNNSAIANAMKDFKSSAKHYRQKLVSQKRQGQSNNNENQEEKNTDDDSNEDVKEEEEDATNEGDEKEQEEEEEEEKNNSNESVGGTTSSTSRIASLKCDTFGGPSSSKAAEEMVYWRDVPSDSKFVSPFKKEKNSSDNQRQYLTFDPDGGGWNNIRMAMETVVGLAMAMGRTLVLPPAQGMYLLGKDKGKQNTHFSFGHFFPFDDMKEQEGLDMITMEQFLSETYGRLRYTETGEVAYPPGNRTQWDGQDYKPLKEWLRNVTYIQHMWKPGDCLAAFPASGNHKDVEFLENAMQELIAEKNNGQVENIKQFVKKLPDQYMGKPVDVDSPPLERLQENLNGRSKLCVYDEAMQGQLVMHFMCYHKMRIRYLVHSYAFLFFEDWRHDLHMKRYMRDHMRYINEIQCAAARIVEALRNHQNNKDVFDTMHIRRGDFQFKDTRIDAKEIIQNSRDVLSKNKTIFIATDERDKSFFQPFRDEGYDILFLDDFHHLLQGVNTNYYGMIDQLVASKGDIFLGCWHSTFTGFIMRMRGYHSTKLQLDGYLDGALPTSYYYATMKNKFAMRDYTPLSGAFFNREFPTSWRQIDKGIS